MSLDDIVLPAQVVQELYRDVLVELTPPVAIPAASADDSALTYLGDNQKQVAVIVDDPESIYLQDEALNFLLGILTACKLSMADIALINSAKNPGMTYQELEQQLHAKKLILFGVAPAVLQLPLQFPHYQVQQYNNQVYLASPALRVLMNDRAEKTKLWVCLKQVFQLT